MTTLKELVDQQIEKGLIQQNKLYDNLVMPSILNGGDVGSAYKDYTENLNHFDIAAFRKVINKITSDKENNPEAFANWSEEFSYIPQYANARNNWDKKVKEILDTDSDMASKQSAIDSMDFSRTKAHNGVIALFNHMNKYATQNNIAQPYPNNGAEFDRTSAKDREIVASILTTQEPLLDSVNKFLLEEKETLGVTSETEQLRSMSLTELVKYAAQKQSKSLEDFTNGLESLEASQLSLS